MSVPKQRHTKGRRDRKRARFKIEETQLVACPQCKKMMKPHQACLSCGYYKGKEVIDTLKKKTKKAEKAKAMSKAKAEK